MYKISIFNTWFEVTIRVFSNEIFYSNKAFINLSLSSKPFWKEKRKGKNEEENMHVGMLCKRTTKQIKEDL